MKTNYRSAVLFTFVTLAACHTGEGVTKITKTPAKPPSDNVSPPSDSECVAPVTWFQMVDGVRVTPPPNEGPTSPFANNQTVTNCDFQHWSWQKFLWLTNQDANGRPLFMKELIQVATTGEKQRNDVVVLTDTAQASGENDILKTPANAEGKSTTVYYSIFVDEQLYSTMSTYAPIAKEKPQEVEFKTFPVGALELKTSWIEATAIADSSSYFVTNGVFVDRSGNKRPAQVALLGMHVVGVVENHPEFVWATFEHHQLAPDYDWGRATPSADAPVTSATNFPFFKAGATATVNNITSDNEIYTNIFSLYKYGVPVEKKIEGNFDVQTYMKTSQNGSQNFNNIRTLNKSVQQQLKGVWNNYFENGSLWINTEGYNGTEAQAKLLNGLGSNLGESSPGKLPRGSVAAYNVTMETYVQAGFGPTSIHAVEVSNLANCFACHTAQHKSQKSPLYLSHVFNGYLGALNGLTKAQVKTLHVQEVRQQLQLRSRSPR